MASVIISRDPVFSDDNFFDGTKKNSIDVQCILVCTFLISSATFSGRLVDQLKWELVKLRMLCLYLIFLAYSHPYVISFSERAIDVFDSSSAEWLQTIPIKKVHVL